MHPSFVVSRRVEFCETDAAGIAHFSAFLIYMEQAEHALLRHLGLSVVQPTPDGRTISWPRVSVHCDFMGAVKFEEVLDVAVGIERLGAKSVTYRFEFTRSGATGSEPVASGKIVAVCCELRSDEPPKGIPIPDWIVDRLRTYLATP